MEIALAQAGLSPRDIGHLNAHATSTPVEEESELAAIRHLFGAGSSVAVSATKSAGGHLLGAAGGLEAISTALALRNQITLPTLNLTDPDPAVEGIHIVALTARRITADHAISNGFGFGGVNASLVLRRMEG